MYVLDTNTLIYYFKGQGHSGYIPVLGWQHYPRTSNSVFFWLKLIKL